MTPRRRVYNRIQASDDEGVVQVVSAGLMVAAFVIFVATFNATWVPVWVANAEAAHADALKGSVEAWADAAEDATARSLVDRTFVRTLPVGAEGLPILGVGASGGTVRVQSDPTLEVYDPVGGTADHVAGGSVAVATDPQRHPATTFTYALGALQVSQDEGAWVDLRNLLSVERDAGGLAVRVQAVGVEGAPQSVGSNDDVSLAGTLTATDEDEGDAVLWLRVRVSGVEADAWRNAVRRDLGGADLDEDADGLGCATSTDDYCFDASTNTASTMDLYLIDVLSGWTVTEGTVVAEVRS